MSHKSKLRRSSDGERNLPARKRRNLLTTSHDGSGAELRHSQIVRFLQKSDEDIAVADVISSLSDKRFKPKCKVKSETRETPVTTHIQIATQSQATTNPEVQPEVDIKTIAVPLPSIPPSEVNEEDQPKPTATNPEPQPAPVPSVAPSIQSARNALSQSQQSLRLSPPAVISRVHTLASSLESRLKSMKFEQRRVLRSSLNTKDASSIALISELLQRQDTISKLITESNNCLSTIFTTKILGARDCHILVTIQDHLKIHAKQLQLLRDELLQFNKCSQQPGLLKPHAALVVTKQPFPCTVKQSKSLDDPVELSLLTGSLAEITSLGMVKAELISEDYNPTASKRSNQPAIRNCEERLKENGIVYFKKLTFPHGSRVKAVAMKFGTDIILSGVRMRLQSDSSKPFIVMTNHGQRSITEGKLLKKTVFGGKEKIPWALFANTLQLHYLKATRQDPMKAMRTLSEADIQYLHKNKFKSKDPIMQEDFDVFYKWFGKILYKIRNPQKQILPLWLQGIICGFLTREESDLLLSRTPPHSFLIRFSDRCPGLFVVVYVTQNENEKKQVKHYLVSAKDIENHSSLPDFLRQCQNLWYLVQLTRDENDKVAVSSREKDSALGPFYTQRKENSQLPVGYVSRIG